MLTNTVNKGFENYLRIFLPSFTTFLFFLYILVNIVNRREKHSIYQAFRVNKPVNKIIFVSNPTFGFFIVN